MSKVFDLIKQESIRQTTELELIPSENYVSTDVLTALGSILTNKYSEGYPGARYYAGNQIIDSIERYTQDLANQLFGTVHAIVQPYSGSPANLAVCLGLLQPGDTIMGLKLSSGGHLTHGAEASFTGKLFRSVSYEVESSGKIDTEKLAELVKAEQPKLIWVGTTAYPYILDYSQFRSIADSVGAILVADISHIAGLIAGGVHPSPVKFVDIITTTTHKTLRGPRGAMILITQLGLDKDPDLISKLEKAVFPGLQGGPHNNVTASIAVALEEALKPEFKDYAKQVIKNAAVLANQLGAETENHLILLDLSKRGFGLGYQAHIALEASGIIVNKNTVPGESASAFYPSGIRLGTPALTSRGMKEPEMIKIAGWINQVLDTLVGLDLPIEQASRKDFIKSFRTHVADTEIYSKIKAEIAEFAKHFPVPGIK